MDSNGKVKRRRKFRKGDGTRNNPVILSDKELSLVSARDIKYHYLDGTPGLMFRKGKNAIIVISGFL